MGFKGDGDRGIVKVAKQVHLYLSENHTEREVESGQWRDGARKRQKGLQKGERYNERWRRDRKDTAQVKKLHSGRIKESRRRRRETTAAEQETDERQGGGRLGHSLPGGGGLENRSRRHTRIRTHAKHKAASE